MEEVVIKTMKRFQSDFYKYDEPRIANSDFKFPAIWIVGESYTHLLELGNYRDAFFDCASVRFDYLRQHNPYQYYLTDNYFAKDKWFLITEDGLQPTTREQANTTIMDYVLSAVCAWEEHNSLPTLTKVPIKFKNITLSELKALIADCHAHGNNSLFDCFKIRQNTRRIADDQSVTIIYRKKLNEFIFHEYVDGNIRLVGGIIFHGWPETGYEINGAVQIAPTYGWSSHT